MNSGQKRWGVVAALTVALGGVGLGLSFCAQGEHEPLQASPPQTLAKREDPVPLSKLSPPREERAPTEDLPDIAPSSAPVPDAGSLAFDAGDPFGGTAAATSVAPPAAAPERVEPDPQTHQPRGNDRDRRFQVRWASEGLCADRPLSELRAARDALLSTFQQRQLGDATLLMDPRVDAPVASRVFLQLQHARSAVTQWVDWFPNSPPPVTVIYRDSAQLRSVACASEQTVGYYDGRLHISADPALPEAMVDQTVVHEYVHFALNTVGVAKPMWLHEGLAMHVAEETWWTSSRLDLQRWLQNTHLPFESMVYAFPHTADEKFATAAYYQSYRMVDFVSAQRGPEAIRELVRRLSAHAVDEGEAFTQGAGITPSTLEAQWELFVREL